MTDSYARTVGGKIRDSGAIVPIGFTVVLMIIVSGDLWIMDNYSSYVAVREMAVNTIRDGMTGWGVFFVQSSFVAKAFVPQGLATIMFSVFLLMEAESSAEVFAKWASLVVGIIAWTYDGWTGYIFYLHPVVAEIPMTVGYNNPMYTEYYRDALINAVIYDALGSEFLLSITVGIFSVIAADWTNQVRNLLSSLSGTVGQINLPSFNRGNGRGGRGGGGTPVRRPTGQPVRRPEVAIMDNFDDDDPGVPVGRGPAGVRESSRVRQRPPRPNGMRRSPLNGLRDKRN